METARVILVDDNDNEVGTAGKTEAHQKGLLHRAFSIFIFNSKGEMLLQQRAMTKYHSGGLWTNACCSHPQPGQRTEEAAARRLQEELGFTSQLEKVFDFVYKTGLDNGLTEHEFDHVFTGEYDGEVMINKEEAAAVCWKQVKEIAGSLKAEPDKYTVWFRLAFPRIQEWWGEKYKAHNFAK